VAKFVTSETCKEGRRMGRTKQCLKREGRSPMSSDHVRVPVHGGGPLVKIMLKSQGIFRPLFTVRMTMLIGVQLG